MKVLVALALVSASAPAAADVVSASPNGFEIRETVPLVVKPEAAFAAFARVGAWWNKDHTYSGNSANLSLALTPGGCFCERLPESGGGVEHLRVAYVEPGKRVVLTGSLGPLLYEGVAGVMDVQVKATGGGSELTLNYRAAGFARGGADKLAPLVDKVLTEQLKRYRAFVTKQPRT